MKYKKFILILLAFQSYTQAAPKGSLADRFENTTDEKEKHTLKEWIDFLKNNTIDPDTTIPVSWSFSNNIIQRCAYQITFKDFERAQQWFQNLNVLKEIKIHPQFLKKLEYQYASAEDFKTEINYRINILKKLNLDTEKELDADWLTDNLLEEAYFNVSIGDFKAAEKPAKKIQMLTTIGIDPLTEIPKNWRDSKDLKQYCAYHTIYGNHEIAIATHRKIDILKQNGMHSTVLTYFWISLNVEEFEKKICLLQKIGMDPSTKWSGLWILSNDIKERCASAIYSHDLFNEEEKLIKAIIFLQENGINSTIVPSFQRWDSLETFKKKIALLQKIGIDPSTEISQNWWGSKDLKQRCAYKIQSGFFEEAEELIETIKEKEQELETEPTGQPTKKIHRDND